MVSIPLEIRRGEGTIALPIHHAPYTIICLFSNNGHMPMTSYVNSQQVQSFQWSRIIRRGVLISAVLLIIGCTRTPEPQLLPWSEQWQHVQALAHEQDATATLSTCVTIPRDRYSTSLMMPSSQSLNIRCKFRRSNGTTFEIAYDDQYLANTIRITPAEGYTGPVNRQIPETLHIGPREALAAARPLSQDFLATVQEIKLTGVVLSTDHNILDDFGVPAVWTITHFADNEQQFDIWVNPLDGTVIEPEEAKE